LLIQVKPAPRHKATLVRWSRLVGPACCPLFSRWPWRPARSTSYCLRCSFHLLNFSCSVRARSLRLALCFLAAHLASDGAAAGLGKSADRKFAARLALFAMHAVVNELLHAARTRTGPVGIAALPGELFALLTPSLERWIIHVASLALRTTTRHRPTLLSPGNRRGCCQQGERHQGFSAVHFSTSLSFLTRPQQCPSSGVDRLQTGAGRAGRTASASVRAFPRLILVGFANPACVFAAKAFHRPIMGDCEACGEL
jgi:hypothetical protein